MLDLLLPKAKRVLCIALGILFLLAAVYDCSKPSPRPSRRTVIARTAIDGTEHPFRDTLVVYRDRVTTMKPDTLVRYVRILVHDTVEVEGDSVLVPVETVRRVAVRVLSDSIRIYTDSVRRNSDSLYIHDLKNASPDTVEICPESPVGRWLERVGTFGIGVGMGLLF